MHPAFDARLNLTGTPELRVRFLAGRSTVTNAAVHSGAKVVVKFDLKDFYPTVTMPRVKGMFRKAGYTEQVATVMALLCTESPREEIMLRGRKHYVAVGPRSLPQGAPTSPSITNAISLRLDCRLAGLARETVARQLEGKEIVKTVVVPGRLVNFVVR